MPVWTTQWHCLKWLGRKWSRLQVRWQTATVSRKLSQSSGVSVFEMNMLPHLTPSGLVCAHQQSQHNVHSQLGRLIPSTTYPACFRVTTHLENLEKSGNSKVQGKWKKSGKSREVKSGVFFSSSKYSKTCFLAGALPRTPLGSLRRSPRSPSRLGRRTPIPVSHCKHTARFSERTKKLVHSRHILHASLLDNLQKTMKTQLLTNGPKLTRLAKPLLFALPLYSYKAWHMYTVQSNVWWQTYRLQRQSPLVSIIPLPFCHCHFAVPLCRAVVPLPFFCSVATIAVAGENGNAGNIFPYT